MNWPSLFTRLLPLAVLLGACGDPLMDGRYRGEPLFTLEGTVLSDAAPQDYGWPDGELRISIEWAEWKGSGDRGVYDVEELETLTSFPAQFEVNIFHPAPLDALFQAPWLPGELVSVGRPLLFVDENDNGSLEPQDELVVGGAFDTVLVYVETPWEDEFGEEWGEEVDERWDDEIWEDEPYGDRGLELHYGYQRMYDLEELCEWAEHEEDEDDPYDEEDDEWDSEDWFPPEDEPVYLFVGDVDGELYFDWECDGIED